jgi:hypothetical protein
LERLVHLLVVLARQKNGLAGRFLETFVVMGRTRGASARQASP